MESETIRGGTNAIQDSLHPQRPKPPSAWRSNFREWDPRKRLRQRRPTEHLIKSGRDTDIFISYLRSRSRIMGLAGVGKSTFMNHVAGSTVARVGHALASCTNGIQCHTIENAKAAGFDLAEGRRLVLVDTPGFDHTYINDSEILHMIAVWLASSYDSGMKLGGVMYLRDISAKRLTTPFRLNIKMFEKLCGSKAFDKIVLGTTKWSAAGDDPSAQTRLAELKKGYWAGLLDKGARELRIDDNQESCRRAVNVLLNAGTNRREGETMNTVLRIHQEVVEEGKSIPETEAGKVLRYTPEDILKFAETKQRGKIQGEIEWPRGQIEDLNTGFFRRLKWQWNL
ncbi:hypothetical protein BKA70DRAFT_1088540 [Coprinopsis sp. MPI-PUGE-AT-0042]|nr:hypothetical protein BKA70DRAFT_1088540 [Coprinopsis sp. MPI-PUGE-AT-0042]